jgi:uncharacterized protein
MTAFIKKFKSHDDYYIYDVNSNELIQVDEIIYDLIDNIGDDNLKEVIDKFQHKYGEQQIREKFTGIKEVQKEHGLFSTHRPTIASNFQNKEDIEAYLHSGLSQIILELSNRCNLRCKYCTFSGIYEDNRTHGSDDMSREIALKAIDYFIQHSKKASKDEPPAITFYGGESLLRFDILKEVVEYTKKKKVFDDFYFSLTTNGTLLTEEVIHYFVENEIMIMISLDGPREENDRYRVFADGEGTFSVIYESLKKIKAISPEYFSKHIMFNAVISPPFDFDSIIDFFYHNEFLKDFKDKVKINFVDSYGTTFFQDFKLEKDVAELPRQLNRLRDRYKEALIEGSHEDLTIEREMFLGDFHRIATRRMEPLGEWQIPLGMCVPGGRRLFVDTMGDFYMCEKVGANYKIGNVEDGIDFESIQRFYRQYDKYFASCSDCWAVRLCTKCFNDIRTGSEFDENRMDSLCKRKISRIEDNLAVFSQIIKQNPDAFNIFKNVTLT